MNRFLLKWALTVAALVLASFVAGLVVSGFKVDVSSAGAVMRLFVGVVAISVLNATLGRVLKFLAIPLNCLTLGLVSVLINALMFNIAGNLNLGFQVSGFLPSLIGSVAFSLLSSALHTVLPDDNKQ
jgi:putative membrane protein